MGLLREHEGYEGLDDGARETQHNSLALFVCLCVCLLWQAVPFAVKNIKYTYCSRYLFASRRATKHYWTHN